MKKKVHKLPYIVVLDFGTSSGKCSIFDSRGSNIYQVNTKWCFPTKKVGGDTHASFDTTLAWEKISTCCKQALKKSDVDLKQIACVITTSQRHGAVLLDKIGNSLFAFSNADERNDAQWQKIATENPESIYHISGRWPQKLFLPAHISWLQQHQPSTHKLIGKVLGIQDWLIYKLSGEICSEATIATDLLLFNISKGDWSDRLIHEFNIESAWLPNITQAGIQIGTVTSEAANSTGLLQGTPVLNGAADSQMAMLGLGAIGNHDLVAAFGSSIPVLLSMDHPALHPDAVTWTNRHIFSNLWALESNAGDAGICLYRFRNNFLTEIQKSLQSNNEVDIPSLMHLDTLVSRMNWEETNLIASVGPMVFNGREWPEVTGIIKGLNFIVNGKVGVTQLYQALIQNIGYAILGNIQQLEEMVPDHIRHIYIGGPAIESPIWPQLLANILDRPIKVPDEKEVTPMGTAVLAAWNLGLYSTLDMATSHMVRLKEVKPNSGVATFYKQQYQDWLEVYMFSKKDNRSDDRKRIQ